MQPLEIEALTNQSQNKTKSSLQQLQQSLNELSEAISTIGPSPSRSVMENLRSTLVDINEEVELLKSVVQYQQGYKPKSVLKITK